VAGSERKIIVFNERYNGDGQNTADDFPGDHIPFTIGGATIEYFFTWLELEFDD
jgi:hypothetical protein